jgi:hypothetical protein
MKNSAQPTWVTEATFKKEAAWVRKTMMTKADGRLLAQAIDKNRTDIERIQRTMMTKDDGQHLVLAILKNTDDIQRLEKNMMTKDAGDLILSQLQDLAKKYETAELSARIHLNQVMDFRPRIEDHEQRLVALEKRPPTLRK